MTLYLDVEFNGHAGELISLALASTDGSHFYRALPLPAKIDPWVLANVVPVLGTESVPKEQFRAELFRYLFLHGGEEIVADWPDDFVHLLRQMSGPSYMQRILYECRMHLLTNSNPIPEVPHNALSDAIALMRWHQAQP